MTVPDSREFLDILAGYSADASPADATNRAFKLATVEPYYSSGPVHVTFDGESVPSLRGYTWADPYQPNGGDRVYMIPVGNTFIVGGKVSGQVSQLRQTQLTLQNSWTEYSPGFVGAYEYGRATVAKDRYGFVIFSGLLVRGSVPAGGSVITNVPAPFRPSSTISFGVQTSAAYGRVEILANGDVVYQGGATGYFSLENIRYRAADMPSGLEVINPTYNAGWVDYGSSFGAGQIVRDPNGVITTKMFVKNGTVAPGTDFYTYPSGSGNFFTRTSHHAIVSNSGIGYVRIGGAAGSGDGRVMDQGQGWNATWTSPSLTWTDNSSPLVWTTPTLSAGWTQYEPAIFSLVGYTKTADGIVHLKGLVGGGSGTIFMLPEGYRPKKQKLFVTVGSDVIARLDVTPAGGVQFSSGNSSWLTLSGLSFVADGA